jgi:hypothetical protein
MQALKTQLTNTLFDLLVLYGFDYTPIYSADFLQPDKVIQRNELNFSIQKKEAEGKTKAAIGEALIDLFKQKIESLLKDYHQQIGEPEEFEIEFLFDAEKRTSVNPEFADAAIFFNILFEDEFSIVSISDDIHEYSNYESIIPVTFP